MDLQSVDRGQWFDTDCTTTTLPVVCEYLPSNDNICFKCLCKSLLLLINWLCLLLPFMVIQAYALLHVKQSP